MTSKQQMRIALKNAENLLTHLDGSGNQDPMPCREYVSQVRRQCLEALK